MDLAYKLDYNLCKRARKLFDLSHFSFESVLMRYLYRLLSLPERNTYERSFVTESNRKYIWVFWAQGEKGMPPIVSKCYQSIKEHTRKEDLVLLSMDNIEQFVQLPSIIYDRLRDKAITYTHFSDILRFALLKEYGGWWIDATIFLTADLPATNSLFTIKNPFDRVIVSKNLWSSFLWYLPPNHPLAIFAYDSLIKYWERNAFVINYLLTDFVILFYYRHNKSFRHEIDSIKESNHYIYFFQSEEALMPFDANRWKDLQKDTTFFKTTYKIKTKNIPANSYYRKLLCDI